MRRLGGNMKSGKAIAVAAVATIALCGVASARSKVTTISIDGFCDELTVTVNKTTAAAISVPDACESILGGGVIGKVKGVGQSANAGVIIGGDGTTLYVAQLSYPFTTGGTITLYYTPDGTNLNLLYTTTYTVEGTPSHGIRGTRRLSAVLHR